MKPCVLALFSAMLILPLRGHAAPGTDETQVGRLFMTPEKRAMLDRQRKFDIRDADGLAQDNLELNGIVQRSSGHNSVWINQRMQYGQEGVRIKRSQPGTANINMDRGASVELKVGDAINRSTQERQGLVPPNAVQRGKN